MTMLGADQPSERQRAGWDGVRGRSPRRQRGAETDVEALA